MHVRIDTTGSIFIRERFFFSVPASLFQDFPRVISHVIHFSQCAYCTTRMKYAFVEIRRFQLALTFTVKNSLGINVFPIICKTLVLDNFVTIINRMVTFLAHHTSVSVDSDVLEPECDCKSCCCFLKN